MTGLERNADIVNMVSYAPLLAHVDAWQWRPDLIWFDNLTAIGTPNYYVQKLFSNYKGTHAIQVLRNGQPLSGQDSLYASGTIDKNTGKVYIKIVNTSGRDTPVELAFEGLKTSGDAIKETLKAKNLYDFNSIENPKRIFPSSESAQMKGRKLRISLDPVSVNTIILNYMK
jgi:alpha-L-arabinofuranosidase